MQKPPYVLDRDHEWAALGRFLERGGRELRIGVMSGRRRYGKSFLLRALTEAVGGLYITAVQEEGRLVSQRRFSTAIARYAKLPESALNFGDWQEILTSALEVVADSAFPLLVIDELPYVLTHSPEIPSLIQHLYDDSQLGRAPGGRLILCGSSVSVMSQLLSGTKALRGRAVLDMRLGPFDYRQAADLWGVTDPEVAFRLHAILGGAPGYHQLVQDQIPTSLAAFDTWVEQNLLDPFLGLFSRNETEYLLREDTRITQRTLYYDILGAVAVGANTPSKIGAAVGRERTAVSYPLNVLLSSGYLRRDEDLLRTRSVIKVADPVIRFNQLVTMPYIDVLEQHHASQVWQDAAAIFTAKILGPHFEDLARAWTRHFASHEVLGDRHPGAIGAGTVTDSRARSKLEIDVLAFAPGQAPRAKGSAVMLIGEAKSTMQRRTPADLARLDEARTALAANGYRTDGSVLALFSRTGFTSPLVELAGRRDDVVLLDTAALYGRKAS